MTAHEKRVWDTPDEENLASLMNRASALLLPREGYSLELELHGVTGSQLIMNELEAQFDTHLDREKGSKLWMTLHPVTRKLVLNQFSADLTQDCGKINLQRTDAGKASFHKFIPSVELLGKNIEARGYTWNPEWQNGFLERLICEHGLDNEQTPDPAAYRMWLGHTILSKAQKWMMVEQLDLDQQVSKGHITKNILKRRQNLLEDTHASSVTVSMIHETTNCETNITDRQRIDMVSYSEMHHFKKSSVRITVDEQVKSDRSFGDPNIDDIAHFTNIVEKALSPEH